MKSTIKELLKEDIKEVNQSKKKVVTGVVLLIADIILVTLSLLSIYTLILTLPLLFILRKQIMDYRMKKMVLVLTRYILDDEFAKEFDKNK
jgi:hypothetical protein|tara:strand:+ start:773 stop:1045 length:273 start_codon:yes stop_codon:yes gene_type:complete